MKKVKIFLASSIELENEIILFGNEVGKKNNTVTERDVYFELKTWRDYSARMVKEGSQGLYNESIREGDIFVLLAYTKVGEYSEIEFDNAHSSFIDNGSPIILTYFKDPSGQPIEESVTRFQEKLTGLRHYFSAYSDFNDLWNKFNVELDRVIQETPSFRLLSNPDHFNRSLTIRVMNALAGINPVARKLIGEMEKRSPAWENEKRFIDQIKESLANKFIGVVGTEVGRLMAIGKNAYSEEKPADYLSKCQKIASICIRTIAYVFVAKLWNRLSAPLPIDFELSSAQTRALQSFFDGDEMDSPAYFDLMQMLVALYRDIRLEFPIPELEPIAADFATGSALSTAFSKLNDLSKTTSCSLAQCAKAEDHLSLILEKFIFLTQYEMISVKAVQYDMVWEQSAGYIHNYIPLTAKISQPSGFQALAYDDAPIHANAILFYKGSYKDETQCTNLYPFVIDLNTLVNEPGNKICFFNQKLFNLKILNYVFLEMNERVNVEFKNVLVSPEDGDISSIINEAIQDEQKRTQLKMDNTFRLFAHAAKTLAGLDFGTETDIHFDF